MKRKSLIIKRRKQRNRRIAIAVGILLFGLSVAGIAVKGLQAFSGLQSFTGSNLFAESRPTIDFTGISSRYAMLTELESGMTVAQKEADQKMYPASMTKIMTTITALEHLSDINQNITVPEEIFDQLYMQNASRAGFEPGEEVLVRDMLYGIMLPSGSECCLTLAHFIAGSEAGFTQLMNQKAAELGLDNTHYNNVTGLSDENHYTTAKDMTTLLKYALENETFRNLFTARSYSTTPSNRHPEGFMIHSTTFDYLQKVDAAGVEILGGKTGYTAEAGRCLASLASINGKEYILVTGYAEGPDETVPYHLQDAVNIYQQINKY